MNRDFLTGKPIPETRYQEYLLSTEWKAKCAAVRTRCNNICERCHRYLVDHVHHLTYKRVFNELLEDLQGVCATCHSFVHGNSAIDPLRKSIRIKVTPKLIQFWDRHAAKFRRIRIAKLPTENFRWGKICSSTGEVLELFHSEDGEYQVPMEVFLDGKGNPVIQPSRWTKFKVASQRGRSWWQVGPVGRGAPNAYQNEDALKAKARSHREERRLRESPEKCTSFQGNVPFPFKRLRALFKEFPRVVLSGIEYSIRDVRQTKWKGVVLDLQRATQTGFIRGNLREAEQHLATGRLVLDRERRVWLLKERRST